MPEAATDDSGSYNASFGAMATDASRATASIASAARDKVAADTKISNEMTQRGEEDRARAVKALDKSGVGPEEFKPWNAEIEHKKYESDPLQGFASSGAMFAMIASAFTKAPMLSALEGMTGALNGIKEGNETAYTRAFDSYKENVKTAKAKHEIEHQAYTDALALGTHDQALSSAKFRAEAARFGDKQMLALAENGMVKEIYEAIAARNRSMESTSDLAEKTTIRGMQQQVLKLGYAAIDSQQGPPGPDGQPTKVPDEVKASQKMRLLNTTMASGKMTTPQQIGIMQMFMEHPTMPVEEVFKKAEEKGIIKPAGGNSEAARQGNDIRARATVLVEEARQRGEDLPFTVAEGQAKSEASGSGKKLDDKTLNQMADQAIAGDTSVFTNLGRGAQGSENVIALRKRIADKLAEGGKSGADQAKAAAAYQGDRAAFRAAGTQEARVGTAAFEAKNMMKIARDESEKVWRTRFVPINQALQAFERNTGDPEIRAFGAANNSLVNAYVRAISPTGTPTDIVRTHAYDLLRTADSKEAYESILKVMEREMEAAVASPGQFREMMLKTGTTPSRAAEGASVPALGGPGKVIRYDKDGKRVQE